MNNTNSISIYPHELKSKLDNQDELLLLDVREPMEREWANLENSTHIPMGEMQDRHHELQEYRDKEIIVYCHSGVRSFHVTQFLLNSGFTIVKNLEGGIDAWSLEVDPTIPRY
jgi:sulfur-carrier protein adenylyltransferase/sulfurtransferase